MRSEPASQGYAVPRESEEKKKQPQIALISQILERRRPHYQAGFARRYRLRFATSCQDAVPRDAEKRRFFDGIDRIDGISEEHLTAKGWKRNGVVWYRRVE